MSHDLACKYTSDKMIERAYAEYTQKVANNYGKFYDLIQGVLTRSMTLEEINTLISEAGFEPYASITMNDVQDTISNFLYTINVNNEEQLSLEVEGPITINGYTYDSINDIFNEVQATYHAIVTDNAVALSFLGASSVAERIAIVRDTISTTFKNSFTDTSGYLNSAVDYIKRGEATVRGWMQNVLKTSGLQQAAETGDPFSMSSSVEYSGATPASAYCWDSVGKSIVSGVKVVAKTVTTIFSGITKLGRSIFKKATKAITQVVANPYDIEAINNNSSTKAYTINGFYSKTTINPGDVYYEDWGNYAYHWSSTCYRLLKRGPAHFDFFPVEMFLRYNPENEFTQKDTIRDNLVSILFFPDDNVENFVSFKDLFENSTRYPEEIEWQGTLVDTIDYLIDMVIFGNGYDGPREGGILNILQALNLSLFANNVEIFYRLKPIMRSIVGDFSSDDSDDSIIMKLNLLADNGDSMYATTGNDEKDLFNSFVYSGNVISAMTKVICAEMNVPSYSFFDNPSACFKSSVNNYDFFKMYTQPLNSGLPNSASFTSVVGSISELGVACIAALIEENFQPLDFQFFPYSQNDAQWFDSAFQLKTDQQNIDAFNNFITTAVVVVGVTILAIYTGIKLKRLATQSYLNQQGALWRCSEAASKGELTPALVKEYQKATKRSNRMNALAGPLLTSAGSGESSDQSSLLSFMVNQNDANITTDEKLNDVLDSSSQVNSSIESIPQDIITPITKLIVGN